MYNSVLDLIDFRSFSNVWFWLMLALVWMLAGQRVLGMPWDMALRARRGDAETVREFETMARIGAARVLRMAAEGGVWIIAGAAFLLTVLMVSGFFYRVEAAQALFLLLVPLVPVWLLAQRTARAVIEDELTAEALYKRLSRYRLAVQGIGVLAIFVTALWGMLYNLGNSSFGW